MKKLDDTVKSKIRKFGKQAQLTFTKTHRTKQDAEKAEAHAGIISSKFNNIGKKKVRRKTWQVYNGYRQLFKEKLEGELSYEYVQFTKQTDLKKKKS